MLSKISILSLSFGLLFSSISQAEEPIDGAFGFKLGDSFNQSTAIQKVTINNTDMYEVKATQPYVAFNQYYIEVSPKSSKIQSIHATGQYSTLNDCVAEYKVLLTVLDDKYKNFKEPVKMNKNGYSIGMQLGANSITTMCNENEDKSATMAISYLTSESTETKTPAENNLLLEKIDARGL